MPTINAAGLNSLAAKLSADLSGGSITFFSGAIPANAADAATGTKLGDCTVIAFDAATAGTLPLTAPHQSNAIATEGTVGWARIHKAADDPTLANAVDTRIDVTVGTTGSDLNLGAGASTFFKAGSIQTITSLIIDLNK